MNDPINWTDFIGLQHCGPGSGLGEKIIPDSLDNVYDFSDACKQHDEDYSTPGMPKWFADLRFAYNMISSGFESGNDLLGSLTFAWMYYLGVSYFGENAYNEAQSVCEE